MPIEAGAAIRETLGILGDHERSDDQLRVLTLEQRVWEAWSQAEWASLQGPDQPIEFELEDVAVVLEGLAFTEIMSVELPWFAMVQWTVDFMTAELRLAWTEEEWSRLIP